MIVIALEQDNRVYAYNEKKVNILNEAGKLHNYTDNTVVVTRGNTKYIYSCTGELLGKYPYDFIKDENISGCIK